MRVKICGITSPSDALAAVEAGADAIGLNFVSGPRRIEPVLAREILKVLPPLVTPVALVRLEAGRLPDELFELLGESWVSHVQLYGEVTPEAVTRLALDGFRSLVVVPVKSADFWSSLKGYAGAGVRPHGVVLDSYDPGREGGTGQAFGWEWVQEAREAGRLADWPPIMLAGGLRPENVAEAVRVVRPFAVDVSSGVEIEGAPGRKDPERMKAFVAQARAAGL